MGRWLSKFKNPPEASFASYRQEASKDGHSEHDAFMTLPDACDAKASCREGSENGHPDANDASDAFLDNFTKGDDQTFYCRYCGDPIEWGRDESGKWLPMKPDYTGFHRCKKSWTNANTPILPG